MSQEQSLAFDQLDSEKKTAWKNTELIEGRLKINPDLVKNTALALQTVTAPQGEVDQIVRELMFDSNQSSAKEVDRASLVAEDKKGGIDFKSGEVDSVFAVKNNGGEIKFHIDPAMLEQLQNAPGFMPVIINIQPIKDLPGFLGLQKIGER